MDCQNCQSWLNGYVDNELDTTTATLVSGHLRECGGCARAYDEIKSLRAQIRQHAHYFNAPSDLTSTVLAAVHAEAESRVANSAAGSDSRTWTWRSWLAPAVSAAMFAASALLYLSTPSLEQQLVDEAVSNHVRSLLADHLTDVASTDQHTVKPWFAGKIDFAPPVDDLATQGYPLVGGRLEYLHQQPVAALVYRHDKHFINLFVAPATIEESSTTRSIRGFNVLVWQYERMRFIAVSDLNVGALGAFASLLQQPR